MQVSKTAWTKSDNTSVKFNLTWKVDPCGGTVKVSVPFKLSSPGNSTSYPSNINCAWVLSAPEGETLKVLRNIQRDWNLKRQRKRNNKLAVIIRSLVILQINLIK